jgi:type I restriction enzyme S subunit
MVSDMMTAEQLKNSILQLAMQGKLVSRDMSDEPAHDLLEKIRRKKKELIKAKTVPKDKKMDAVSEEEKLFDIPESWVWTRIGELFQHNTGKALNGSNKEGTVLPYITTSNLYWNRFELDNLKEMPFTDSELDKCTAKKGDLLVCEGGDYGRAAIWNYDYDIRIQNHVHKLRPYETVCVEYFYYVFNYLKNTGQIHGKGIAIQGLSSGALHNLVVPLPPLNEQYRIVDKIHSIIPFWEQYASTSTKLNTLNASFPDMMKKSILQEAVRGKLVPQDPSDEPASELLKRIAEEKQRLIKEGKIKKQKALPEITEDEIPFEISDSWKWVRLIDILMEKPTNGYSPKGVDYKTDYKNLTLTAATSGVFNPNAFKS